MAINSPLEFFSYNKLGHHSVLDDPFDNYTSACPSLLADSNESSTTNVDYVFAPNPWAYSSSSVLSFNQPEYHSSPDQEECDMWVDSTDKNNFDGDQHIINNQIRKGAIRNCNVSSEDVQFMYNTADGKCVKQDKITQKRQLEGVDIKMDKKQCGANKKIKIKPNGDSSPSKDPQSLAAKNRRERISERLKVLQELIPNGSKVDMVSMLEKAFSYVKFLQLQVKVLSTDEFWPAQGKKAPDISQVSEALDAILSSQRS